MRLGKMISMTGIAIVITGFVMAGWAEAQPGRRMMQQNAPEAFVKAVAQANQELGANADSWAVTGWLKKNLSTAEKQQVIAYVDSLPMGFGPGMMGQGPGGGRGMKPGGRRGGGQGAFMGRGAGMGQGPGQGRAIVAQLNLNAGQMAKWREAQQWFFQERQKLMGQNLSIGDFQSKMIQLGNQRNEKMKPVLTDEQYNQLTEWQNQRRAYMMNRRNTMQQTLGLSTAELNKFHQINMKYRGQMMANRQPGNPQANWQAMQQNRRQWQQELNQVLNADQLQTWKLHRAVMMQQRGNMAGPRGGGPGMGLRGSRSGGGLGPCRW